MISPAPDHPRATSVSGAHITTEPAPFLTLSPVPDRPRTATSFAPFCSQHQPPTHITTALQCLCLTNQNHNHWILAAPLHLQNQPDHLIYSFNQRASVRDQPSPTYTEQCKVTAFEPSSWNCLLHTDHQPIKPCSRWYLSWLPHLLRLFKFQI